MISGIEFRTEYGQKSVHIIGLFPDEYNNIKLTSKALHDLILSPLNLSDTNIISKGREDCSTLNDEQAFKKGMFLVQVSFKDAAKKIHEYGGVVVVHAGSKTNSLDEEMSHQGKGVKNVSSLYDSLGVVKEDLFNQNYIDICEIRKENDSEAFYWGKFNKPSIIASDAHETNDIGIRTTWIKADPTFSGLKQIIHEPDRIFIGDTPELLKRVSLNRTKYISDLVIDTRDGKNDTSNIWFKSIHIPLNNELVAIIGNKGSGKSAITDIIGLCADAAHANDFIFLNPGKFKKKGLADKFCSSIKFASGTETESRPLSYNIVSSDMPKVQYLPQRYFETVCNEIGKVESFKKEIEKVVFQYISDENKLRKNSFSELISYKKESIDKEIRELKNKIETINNDIIALEDKKNPEYKRLLESKIAIKQEELRAHIELTPSEKQKPGTAQETPEEKVQRESLTVWSAQLKENTEQVDGIENEILTTALALEELNQFKRDLDNKLSEYNLFAEAKRALALKYSLDISRIISVTYDTSTVANLITQMESQNKERKAALGSADLPENAEYNQLKLKAKVTYCENEIAKVKTNLSQQEQDYQKYLDDHKIWQHKKAEIVGAIDLADTLEYYNYELAYIQNALETDLLGKRTTRLGYSKQIYQKKDEVKTFYDEIKGEIDAKLLDCQEQKLTIDSSFSLQRDFVESFMGFVNKSKIGSFRSQDEGRKLFQEKLLSAVDWNNIQDVENFLNNVIHYFEYDKRDSNESLNTSTFIGDQITKRADCYSFLFSLDFLEPHYELRQNEKKLDELSPGEKGALLLVFYLVLDKSEIPLVIDQPEDNLDNHSVAKVLVPFIRKAKNRRQIIMVTHNPNLAVVADAEQVIHVDIDKTNGNKFSFSSGSIEDVVINAKIVNVLEGTMPAFNTRKRKYHN